MHEKVRRFLEEKRLEQSLRRKKAREEHLINLGLYEKGKQLFEDPTGEYAKLGEVPPYKMQAIDVTDEEYEEICYYSQAAYKNTENTVAQILVGIGVVIFAFGFLYGLLIVSVTDFLAIILAWISSFAIGMVFIGFAEIIKLLQKIANKG